MMCRRGWVVCLLALIMAALLPGAGGAQDLPAPVAGNEPTAQMTIERLYSLPSIIGNAPTGAVWSPDSRRVAFLWNAQGWNFRNVWVAGTTTGSATKLVTDFEQRGERIDPGTDVHALRAQARADVDSGVSSVIWYPDSEKLLAVRSGEFYRVDPLGAPHGVMGTAVRALEIRGGRPSFSPTGSHLAFVRRGDIWLAPVADGEIGEAERLTSIAGAGRGVMRYSWSPDGGSLAVQTRDGSGVAAVLIPDYLGEATTVNEVPRPFPGDEPGRTHLSVISATTGAAVALTVSDDDRDSIFSFQWSADSRRVLVDTSDLYVKDRRILSIDAATGAATTLYREQEPDNVMAYWAVAWAPDGGVYFISDRDDFYHLYHLAPGETVPVAMTAGEWAVERFATTPEGLFVVANTPHPSERQIFRVGAPGAEPVRVSGESGTHSPTYSPDGRWAAVIFSSDAQPPELYLNSLDGSDEIRVTQSTKVSDFDEYEWVTPEYVTFPSHVDGVEIHARLLLPPDFNSGRQYPAIIGSIYSGALRNQWGGRNAHPVWGLDQILLQRGYVVLNIDIRGSWGHGRAFRRKLKQDYGGVDTEDIYSGVKYLIGTGYVDEKRIGLWGSSYGGLMTAMSLFDRPGVFAAGVAGAPATNVWHALTGEMRVMGRPQDNPDAYADSSAFTHAAGLEDPLMIIHGMRDRIVLFKDSVQLLENLMLLGKGHLLELVALPNSPHGWDTRELYQTRYAFRKLVDHFDRYLEPGR